jgi:hypothetical protein
MSHGHETVNCSCGINIFRCRCIEGGKNVRVEKNGCPTCKMKLANKKKKGLG